MGILHIHKYLIMYDREWYETQANRMSFNYFNNHDRSVLGTRGIPWQTNVDPLTYKGNWWWLFFNPTGSPFSFIF
jgi:hypothetical protein